MSDTLTTNIAESVTEMVVATLALMPQQAPMLGLVEKITIGKGFDRVELPRINSVSTVQTPTEGDELVASSQFDLTSTTIQPTHRALMVRVHERAEYFSKDNLIALVSQELSQTQAQDIDTDLTAEFANFGSGNDVGTTNTDLTLATLRQARRLLRANSRANGGPANDMLRLVISPLVEENLFTNLGVQGTVATATATGMQFIPEGWSQEMMATYSIPQNQLLGVSVFWDGYMTEDGSSDFICGMFTQKALQFAVSKDWDMRTFEVPNWIGPIIRCVADYNSGVGRYPLHGAQITADGA